MWNVAIYFIFSLYYTSNAQADAQKSNDTEPLYNEGGLPEISRWPHGQIYYYVDEDYSINSQLEDAIRYFSSSHSCPEFVQIKRRPPIPLFGTPSSTTWLHFTNPDKVRECVHKPSIQAYGEIKVVVGYDCVQPLQIVHSIMHGLGFPDEVTHPQRDLFVSVQWENIQPAYRELFRVRPMDDQPLLDYDAKSIMQFHDRAYSLNGQATIAPLLPGLMIEPSRGLSHIDKMKLRLMFDHECKKRQVGKLLDSCGKIENDDQHDNDSGGHTSVNSDGDDNSKDDNDNNDDENKLPAEEALPSEENL